MGAASFSRSSFLGGVWSKQAQGRFDVPEYRTALSDALNSIPIETGAILRRPGSRYLGYTRTGLPAVLRTFDFRQNAIYTLEFTNLGLRFIAPNPVTGDLQLADTQDPQVIFDISSANPADVNTVTPHGWSTNDEVQFVGLNQLCPLLHNRTFFITVLGPFDFTIRDSLNGAPINGATLGWPPGTPNVQVVRIHSLTTPYPTASLNNIRVVQAEKQAVLLDGNTPQILTCDVLPTSTSSAHFAALSGENFLDGPYLDPVTSGETLTASATSGSVTLTASGAAFGGFAATDVGRLIRLGSLASAWNNATAYGVNNIVSFNGASYIAIQAGSGHQPDAATDFWQPSNFIAWTWAKITAYTSATQVTATVTGAPLGSTAVMSKWRMGLYSNTTGWPTCGTYHEGRLWLSGAVANRIDSSKSNDIFNFAPTATDGTVAADNGISATFNASEVNPIFWMLSDERGIVCGTQSGEWLVFASSANNALSPTNIQAHRVTKNGCANIEPRRTGLTAVFVHRYQRKLLEYFSDVYSGRSASFNLSINAKHLTIPKIEEIAYQQELTPVVWARLGDGSLIGMTYKRESLSSSQGPNFFGWHPHTLGSGRTVESICTAASANGNLDALLMVTNDTTGFRQIEVLTDLFDEGSSLPEAWFVDNAVSTNFDYVINYTGGVALSLTINGLWHLNGKNVDVFAGGLDRGTQGPVVNGSLTILLDPAGPLSDDYIATFGFAGMPIRVGFTYTSRGQITRPLLPQETGAGNGPGLGKKRRTHQFSVLLDSTKGISFGTDFADTLKPALFKSPGGTTYGDLQMYSGVYQDALTDDYSYDGMMSWQITRPYPATICALEQFLHTQDK